jgi:hypothetical protein
MGSFNSRLFYSQRKSSRYLLVRTLGCVPYLLCTYHTSQGRISDKLPELCGPLPKLATFCTLPHTKETNNSLLLLNFFSFSAPPTAFKLSTLARKQAHCLPSRKLSHMQRQNFNLKAASPEIKRAATSSLTHYVMAWRLIC